MNLVLAVQSKGMLTLVVVPFAVVVIYMVYKKLKPKVEKVVTPPTAEELAALEAEAKAKAEVKAAKKAAKVAAKAAKKAAKDAAKKAREQ